MATRIAIGTRSLLAAGLFVLALAGAARADGGRDDTVPTCPRGQVWDSRTQRCVQVQSGVLPDKALADNAYALAKAERYDEALAVLDLMQDRETPQALNYRGYATRKLGRVDEGIGYYLKAVALDPHYAQVREYLGEAYVTKGDIERAREQLRAIAAICGTDCEEYEDLAKAISEQKRG
jgi:tetratricopeptide (TPR) repeat protein